jgi:inner membrane protein
MPTVITHPAVALAASPLLRDVRRKALVLLSGVALTVLPDLDVVAFGFGIPYGHMFGHRGFSHSIVFAALAGGLAALANRQASARMNLRVWGFLFFCALSHGLLDAFTNGGLGIGLLIPFSEERFFFAVRPIQVSPLDLRRFLSGQGGTVLQNELLVVWLPALLLFIVLYGCFKNRTGRHAPSRRAAKRPGAAKPKRP